MNIFLTGATGFIGSHFLSHPCSQEHTITAVRRPGAQPRLELPKQPNWIDKELNQINESDISGNEIVVHLASSGVSPQIASQESLIDCNLVSLSKILEISEKVGVQRAYISGSFSEYGKSADNFPLIPEFAPLLPTNPYASSKAAGYLIARGFCYANNIDLCYLRIFSAYGIGQHENNFWPALKKAALSGEDFQMTVGNQVRDFIPVEAVVDYMWQLITRGFNGEILPEVINIGRGKPVTLREFAEYWWNKWYATGKIHFGALPQRINESLRFVADINVLNAILEKHD